jgi:peroxiredoxin
MMKKTLMIGALLSLFALVGCSTGQEDGVKTGGETTKQEAPATSVQSESNDQTSSSAKTTDGTVKGKVDFDTMFPNKEIGEYAKGIIGQKAADFKLTNLEGKEVQLSDFEGKNVIVEIAQTTCGACMQAQPEMDKFKKEHPEFPVIQVFPMDNKVAVNDFLKKLNSPAHENILTGDVGNTVVRDYKARWTPTLYFINKEGVISFLYVGDAEADFIADMTKLAFE